jgi:hypothetical protein
MEGRVLNYRISEKDIQLASSEIEHAIRLFQWPNTVRILSRQISVRIAMTKAAFSKMKNLFTSKLDLNLRKKLVKCYIWSIPLYGAETWTLRKVDQKYLEIFEMWCWRRMEKIIWTDRVRNEEVLHRVKEERNILHTIKRRKAN